MLLAMQRLGRRQAISGAAVTVLRAVEKAADHDARGVCTALVELVGEERDTGRGIDVVWRILPTLGKIARRHGGEPNVIQAVLPTLHSYLVDTESALRAAALDAWVEIGTEHQLPSSLADLLPALANDTYLIVIKSVLRAARRLDWPPRQKLQLLHHALVVLDGIDGSEHADILKAAISTVTTLSRDDETLAAAVDERALRRAADLDGYDLRDALRQRWLPATTRSPEMARLRLRLAADPEINDRFNASDDEELCDLLDCGAGLAGLPLEDLTAAALALPPDYLLAGAEFAEVAWRAGRPGDAHSIMQAIMQATPDQPAYAHHRHVTQLVLSSAAVDTALGGDRPPPFDALATAAAALAEDDSSWVRDLLRQVRARATIRYLLAGDAIAPQLAVDGLDNGAVPTGPANQARRRADALAVAGSALTASSANATPTGAYTRTVAGLCEVAAHLLRADAAVLDAQQQTVTAHVIAAQRHALLLIDELGKRFDEADPLAGPLVTALTNMQDLGAEMPITSILAEWAALQLPLLIVHGPRQTAVPASYADAVASSTPSATVPSVAVVLASIDGRLITGPQVLRPNFVYELSVEVQAETWPEWADRLDAELLSHLTDAEITTPTFTWHRQDQTGSDQTYKGSGSLVLRFGLTAGQAAPPLLVGLRWRGERNGERESMAVDVAGHRELRLRPYDASRDYLTKYPVFDARLLDLYERLARAGYDHDQLQAFCRLLTAVSRAGLRITWDKKYRRGARVIERTFHDDLYERLLTESELGGRIERGSPLALGFLDVRHDGITAELKVERKTPVTKENAAKYIGQPTQYAAADGARLSILAILDMSDKKLPIGTPENYLFTLEPRIHGLDNPEAPSLVAVMVVNGNLPPPSNYSRRRTPAN
jgi:hypothetical protein